MNQAPTRVLSRRRDCRNIAEMGHRMLLGKVIGYRMLISLPEGEDE